MSSTTYVWEDNRYARFVHKDDGYVVEPITDAENDLVKLKFGRSYAFAQRERNAITWRMQDERSTQVSPALLLSIVGNEDNVAIRDYGREVVAYWGESIFWCPAIDWNAYLNS